MNTEVEKLRRTLTVLFVDSDAGLRRNIGSLLRRNYGEVITSEQGNEAVDFVLKYNPKVVVCNYDLGNMNAVEFVRQIREYGSRARVVLYTDRIRDVKAQGVKLPMIDKKHTGDELLEMLDAVLFQPVRKKGSPRR